MTFRPAYIEIDGGIVRDATLTNQSGTHTLSNEVGTYQFFVELIAADGGRIDIWNGPGYEEAIRQAEAARKDFRIDQPVRDIIAGRGDQ